MKLAFWGYLVVVAAGLAYFLALGLRHA